MDQNSVINSNSKNDDQDDFQDAKTFFTSRTQRTANNTTEKSKQANSLENNFNNQGDTEINIDGDNISITARKGIYGNTQTVQNFNQLNVIPEETKENDNSNSKSQTKEDYSKMSSEDIRKSVSSHVKKQVDLKLRDLKRIWREKDKQVKSQNTTFKNLNQDTDFKFTKGVMQEDKKSQSDTLVDARYISINKYPSTCPTLCKDMLNIVNIKISPKPLKGVSVSKDSTFIIIRTEDNSCFYFFAIKDNVMKELVDQIMETEFNPLLDGELRKEDHFMSRLNSVVNRQTIQSNVFTDVKFVPNEEKQVFTAGSDFLALWFQNDKKTLEIVNNMIYHIQDPTIKLLQPISIYTIFVVGDDNSLQVQLFDPENVKPTERVVFTLKKEPISLIKLFKFESSVTDITFDDEKCLLQVIDELGWLQKMQQIIKDKHTICKLQSKFQVKDNKGLGITAMMQGLTTKQQGQRISHVEGLGIMVQRNDNRILLYNQDSDDQMLKLKDFEQFQDGQISFDPNSSQIYIPVSDSKGNQMKVFDQLESRKGVVNQSSLGQKMKNDSYNYFQPQVEESTFKSVGIQSTSQPISQFMPGSNSLCQYLNLKNNAIQFSFSHQGVMSVQLAL